MTLSALQPVRVAVIDSGWNMMVRHRRVTSGRAYVGEDDLLLSTASADAHDRHGHGTRCGSTILHLAPRATITPVRIFGKTLETSPPALCAALDWVSEQPFDIVNLSLSTSREDMRDTLQQQVDALRQGGKIVVASAANGTGDGYPSVFADVIGVAVRGTITHSETSRSAIRTLLAPELVVQMAGVEHSQVSNSLAAACVSGLVASLMAECGPLELTEIRERINGLTRISPIS